MFTIEGRELKDVVQDRFPDLERKCQLLFRLKEEYDDPEFPVLWQRALDEFNRLRELRGRLNDKQDYDVKV